MYYVNPQVSVISSGDNTDHGHPRANFIASIGKSSRSKSLVFSTEIAGSFAKLTKKEKKKIKISRKVANVHSDPETLLSE